MTQLAGKNVVVVGATGGVGRALVRRMAAEGARILAVARQRDGLDALVDEVSGLDVLARDATRDDAPGAVFDAMGPDVLVVCGGAVPPAAPLHTLTWQQFSLNWESDVRMSFLFCKAALTRPLAPGSVVILISSGAAFGGSPISGGFAGSKRTQMFIANYCQKESNRLELGIRFIALAPAMIMPGTNLGNFAVEGYAKYLGVSASDFVRGMKSPQTPEDVADAVVALAARSTERPESVFTVSSSGLTAMS